MAGEDPYQMIVLGLGAYQRDGLAVGTAYETSLSVTEMLILVEIAANPKVRLTEIGRRLALGKSSISRKLQGLEQKNLISTITSSSDARRSERVLTTKGRDLLELNDQRNREAIARFTSRVSPSELEEIQAFLKTLADGNNAPPAIIRPNESPLLGQMRRISAALSIFGNSFSGSRFSNTEWQFLTVIHYSQKDLRPSDIAQVLCLPFNTVSQLIGRHEEAGYLTREVSSSDKRSAVVRLTKSGVKVLKQIENSMIKILEKGLHELSDKQLARFGLLICKYAGIQAPQDRICIQAEIVLDKIKTKIDRDLARAFVINQLVKSEAQNYACEVIVGSASETFALKQSNEILAIFEFQMSGSEYFLAHLVHAKELENSPLISQSLEQILSDLHKLAPDEQTKNLNIPDHLTKYCSQRVLNIADRVKSGLRIRLKLTNPPLLQKFAKF